MRCLPWHRSDHALLWLGLCLANMNEDARALRTLARAKRTKDASVRRMAESAIRVISSGGDRGIIYHNAVNCVN